VLHSPIVNTTNAYDVMVCEVDSKSNEGIDNSLKENTSCFDQFSSEEEISRDNININFAKYPTCDFEFKSKDDNELKNEERDTGCENNL
jgi:hypothetical protein